MAFEELKQRHAAMWGAGPFERIAHTLEDMHDRIIDSVDAQRGDRWLDLGSGTGELAFLATRTGATIRGADLSPVLVETAKRQAEEGGHPIDFEVADCEALPYGDATFDVVTSSVGVIFAPDHPRVAAELARVIRKGGKVALTAWTADGEIGDFFRLIGKYAPPPVEGAGNSLTWGEQSYCESLLGETFELSFSHHETPWVAESAEDLWNEMAEAFGPIVVLLRHLDDASAATFREEMIALFGRMQTDAGIEVERPYLLILGTRR
jgi:ubiquinone/menaquinone biosynthesis C-methylase UbiE